MNIDVKENDAIKSTYSFAGPFRFSYIIILFVAFGGFLTRELLPIIISVFELYAFGFICLRPLRISSFSDDTFTSSWPREEVRAYDEIRRIINLSPYCSMLYSVIIVYKKGILFKKINIVWIPTDQGIIEHLKARGVKFWNFWFWQEK